MGSRKNVGLFTLAAQIDKNSLQQTAQVLGKTVDQLEDDFNKIDLTNGITEQFKELANILEGKLAKVNVGTFTSRFFKDFFSTDDIKKQEEALSEFSQKIYSLRDALQTLGSDNALNGLGLQQLNKIINDQEKITQQKIKKENLEIALSSEANKIISGRKFKLDKLIQKYKAKSTDGDITSLKSSLGLSDKALTDEQNESIKRFATLQSLYSKMKESVPDIDKKGYLEYTVDILNVIEQIKSTADDIDIFTNRKENASTYIGKNINKDSIDNNYFSQNFEDLSKSRIVYKSITDYIEANKKIVDSNIVKAENELQDYVQRWVSKLADNTFTESNDFKKTEEKSEEKPKKNFKKYDSALDSLLKDVDTKSLEEIESKMYSLSKLNAEGNLNNRGLEEYIVLYKRYLELIDKEPLPVFKDEYEYIVSLSDELKSYVQLIDEIKVKKKDLEQQKETSSTSDISNPFDNSSNSSDLRNDVNNTLENVGDSSKSAQKEVDDLSTKVENVNKSLEAYKEKWKILSQVGETSDNKYSASFEVNKGQIAAVKWEPQRDNDGNILYNDNGDKIYNQVTTILSSYKALEKEIINADKQLNDLLNKQNNILELDPYASTKNIDAQIEAQQEYISLLEKTAKYLSDSSEYMYDYSQFESVREEASRKYLLRQGTKEELDSAKSTSSTIKKQENNNISQFFQEQQEYEKQIDKVNSALEKTNILLNTLDINDSLDKETIQLLDTIENLNNKLQSGQIVVQEYNIRVQKLLSNYKKLSTKSSVEARSKEVNKALANQLSSFKKMRELIEKKENNATPEEKANYEILIKGYKQQFIEAQKVLNVNSELYDKELQRAKLQEISLASIKKIAIEKQKNNKTTTVDKIEADALSLLAKADVYRKSNSRLFKSKDIEALQYIDKFESIITKVEDLKNKIEIAKLNSLETFDSDEYLAAMRDLNKQFSLFQTNIKATKYSTKSLFELLKESFSNLGRYFFSAGAIERLQSGARLLYDNVVNYNKSVVDLQIASGKTEEEVQSLMSTYNDMAKPLGATTREMAESADTWLRQGYALEETNELIAASAIQSKLGQMESADSAQYLTSALKGYKLEAKDAMAVVDKMSAVDLEAAVSLGGLAEAMSQTANSARIAGISMDKLLGYEAVIGEVTQDNMSSVGNSLKRIFSRMGNVKAGKFVDDDGEDISDVEKVLGKLGINLRDSQSEFRNFGEVLDETASKWNSFSSVEQRAIVTALAGATQAEKLLVLLENYDKVLEYTEVSLNSSGTAMNKFGAYQEGLEAKTKKLQATFESFSNTVLNSEVINTGLDFISGLLSGLDDLIDKLGLLGTIGTIGSGILGANGLG